MTLNELKERLATVNELDLLEMLDITSTELVYYLSDCIEEKYEELIDLIEDHTEEYEPPQYVQD